MTFFIIFCVTYFVLSFPIFLLNILIQTNIITTGGFWSWWLINCKLLWEVITTGDIKEE